MFLAGRGVDVAAALHLLRWSRRRRCSKVQARTPAAEPVDPPPLATPEPPSRLKLPVSVDPPAPRRIDRRKSRPRRRGRGNRRARRRRPTPPPPADAAGAGDTAGHSSRSRRRAESAKDRLKQAQDDLQARAASVVVCGRTRSSTTARSVLCAWRTTPSVRRISCMPGTARTKPRRSRHCWSRKADGSARLTSALPLLYLYLASSGLPTASAFASSASLGSASADCAFARSGRMTCATRSSRSCAEYFAARALISRVDPARDRRGPRAVEISRAARRGRHPVRGRRRLRPLGAFAFRALENAPVGRRPVGLRTVERLPIEAARPPLEHQLAVTHLRARHAIERQTEELGGRVETSGIAPVVVHRQRQGR